MAIFGGLLLYGLGLRIIKSFGLSVFRPYPLAFIIPYIPVPVASGFWIGFVNKRNGTRLSLITGALIFLWIGFYGKKALCSEHFWFTFLISMAGFSLGGYLGSKRAVKGD